MKTLYTSVLLCCILCTPLFAQVPLEVSVTLAGSGKGLENIQVVASNSSIGISDTATTNNQGKVRYASLSATGTWKIFTLANDDYSASKPTTITLRANQSASVSLQVREIKTVVAQNIQVIANSSTINTIDAEVSAELNEKTLRLLPVEGRDVTRALYRLPNVSQATGFFSEAPNVSINGANSLYTSYLIDGMDNNENFLGGQRFAMPVGFTQNITVLTNNFSVEYGNTANGVVNLTSKSGGNTVQGEVFYLTRPGSITDASSEYAQRDLSGNQVKDGFMRQQFGASVGGPVVADKTFFYINAEQTFDVKDNLLRSPALDINTTVQGTNSFRYISAKLDHNWSNTWNTSLRANIGNTNIDFQGGGLNGGVTFPSAGYTQDRNAVNVGVKNIYKASSFVSETDVLYGSFNWNYANPKSPNDPLVTVQDPSAQTIAVLGSPGFAFESLENMVQAQQKVSFLLENHTIKVGVGIKNSSFSLFGGGDPNGSYTVRLNDAQLSALRSRNLGANLSVQDIPLDVQVLNYGVELHPQSFDKTQTILTAFAEDVWSVNSDLNVTLGVRWDYDNLSKGGSTSGDIDNIAPRISANYKLSSTSSVSLGFGLFYDKILYAVYSDARQFNSTSAQYKAQIQALISRGLLPANTDINAVTNNGNFTAGLGSVPFLQGPAASTLLSQRENAFSNELRILNPAGYQNPISNQATLGYNVQVDEYTTFTTNVMYNRSYNLFRIRNLNAPAPYNVDPNNVVARTQIQADATRPLPIINIVDSSGKIIDRFWIRGTDTLRGVARNIVMTETSGESEYAALTLVFNRERGLGDIAWRLTYTLSSLQNNTEDINFRAEDANRYDREWAPSVNDRTHIINAFGTWYATENFSLTLAALLQSGQPINRVADARLFGTNDLNGDGSAFGDAYQGNTDRSPGETRNNDRLPWSTTIDLGAQYTIELGSNNLEIRADVFNVLNANNLSGYSNNATQSNQIQAGSLASGLLVRRNSAPPRQFQFGLRYAF